MQETAEGSMLAVLRPEAEVQERLQEQPDLLEAIRLAMDPAGRFRLELPLP